MCSFGSIIADALCAATSASGMRIGANAQNVVGSSASRPRSTNDWPTNSGDGGDSRRGPTASAYSQPKKLAIERDDAAAHDHRPMSACTIATAASGPGVGGTIACVSCIAPIRPVLITPC